MIFVILSLISFVLVMVAWAFSYWGAVNQDYQVDALTLKHPETYVPTDQGAKPLVMDEATGKLGVVPSNAVEVPKGIYYWKPVVRALAQDYDITTDTWQAVSKDGNKISITHNRQWLQALTTNDGDKLTFTHGQLPAGTYRIIAFPHDIHANGAVCSVALNDVVHIQQYGFNAIASPFFVEFVIGPFTFTEPQGVNLTFTVLGSVNAGRQIGMIGLVIEQLLPHNS